jgi:transcriptional regulator with XRE-family HTH domain
MSGTDSNDKPSNDFNSLSRPQLTAIEQRVAGKTQAQAAEAAGVSRETVCRWERHHPAFITECNRRRAELRDAAVDRMRQIDDQALNTVAEQVASGDYKAALEWIKVRGTHRMASEQVGPVDPNQIIEARVEERLKWERNAMSMRDRLYGPPGDRAYHRRRVIEEMRIAAGFGPTPVPPPPTPPAWDVRIFSATPEIAKLVGADGPQGKVVPRQMELPPLDGYDFDTLLDIASDGEWSIDDHPFRLDPVVQEAGYRVVPLRQELRPTLAELEDSDVATAGELWVDEPGWSSSLDMDTSIQLVRQLRWLAQACKDGELLYLWISEASQTETDERHPAQE